MSTNIKKITVLFMVLGVFTFYAFAGIEWTTSIITTGKGKAANKEIEAHTYAQGGNVKQVFERVTRDDMFYFKDGYWLYKSDEDTIYIVNDKKRNYMTISLDGLLQMTGMVGQMVKIEILDSSVNAEVLPDETLLGFPCSHLKITTDYTMKMKILLIKKTLTIHEVKEIWGAQVPGLKDINAKFLKKDMKTGIPDLDELIRKQMEQQKAIGFPLKMITRTTQMDKKGNPGAENTYTMTVTKINPKDFPDSFFEIPADYKKVEGPWDATKKIF